VLVKTRFAFTVFLLHELTTDGVKDAMRRGQFYSVVQPRMLNLSRDRGLTFAGRATYDGTYPQVRSIVVDREARRITIDAAGYDEIVWIARSTSDKGAQVGAPLPSGKVIQRGPVFDFSDRDSTSPYVRAEVIRHTDDGPVRLLLSPFALTRR
jgi:hypothetical protein